MAKLKTGCVSDAAGQQGIMTKELFYPFLDTMMYAFPPTFNQEFAEEGTMVSLKIITSISGNWHIIKTANNWILSREENQNPNSLVIMNPDTAWKLFSKSWRPKQVMEKYRI